eukprot:359408-Chlamydomonas_euryale.AAC.1
MANETVVYQTVVCRQVRAISPPAICPHRLLATRMQFHTQPAPHLPTPGGRHAQACPPRAPP